RDGEQVPVRVVGVVGDVPVGVSLRGLVAAGVVAERGLVPERVGLGRHLVVAVERVRRGAGGVAAGQVGDSDRGEVAVDVVGVGCLSGVPGAGDVVGDRRVGLGENLPGPVVGVAGD